MIARIASVMLVTAALVCAQDKISVGTYKGSWAGASSGGDFRLAITADSKGALGAGVGFTIEGQDVPCKVISVKIDGASIQMVYEFDLQGNKLQSAIKGTLKGKTIEGTYKTTAGDSPVDEGTWKTTAQ
ncbi:MAG TPA: hypothetical protein VNX18_11735 [Bryobacteraceae bacterium]|jgi:hypothetical protein|nr:hypothetical protein [Bryobacteraceae bacterium]